MFTDALAVCSCQAVVGDRRATDDDVHGGVMMFNTGIAEVTLPVDYKLRNIEETERARQERLAHRQYPQKGRSGRRDDAAQRQRADQDVPLGYVLRCACESRTAWHGT